MDEQEKMLHIISQVLGPMVQIEGASLPQLPSLQGSLIGYGDPVSVGDWVIVTNHYQDGSQKLLDDGMPQQIVTIAQDQDTYTVWIKARHGGCNFNVGTLGRVWRTFQKISDKQVPQYLKEALPLPEGATPSTLRQLSKGQVLTKFAGVSEAVCYAATVDRRLRQVVYHEMVPLLLEWKQSSRTHNLKGISLKFPYVIGDFEGWIASERQIEEGGAIVAKDHQYCLYLYDIDGNGTTLAHLFKQMKVIPFDA
jgi:hypothetical protein